MGKSITPIPVGTIAVPYQVVADIVSALDRIAYEAIKVSQGIHAITDLTRGGAPIDDEPGPLAEVVDLAARRRAKGGAA